MSQFLSQNLHALPQDNRNENAKLEGTLKAYRDRIEKTPEESKVLIYETEANDLTILYEDQYPLHALSGAQAEAHRLVEENVYYNKYGINIVVGIGLGYVVQELVANLRAKKSSAKVIIFEPKLDILQFALDNVNLRDSLNYEHLLIFTESEQLWHFVETHMVQGDGVGFCITEGTLQAFSKTLEPMIQRLTIHAENCIRNMNVLKTRSKLWTQEFLNNLPDLPSAYNANQLHNAFEGKVALLCGAGPSLNDVLPHIVAIRDKIVICAVSGAVKTLDAHGLVADFVFGMDYIGPERQMSGMVEPLKHSHVITGPSAEHFMFASPAKSRWISTLKYNEQYSQITNDMFGCKTHEYHTGGTVAFFMLLICVNMGLHDIILAGQDLALRGNQVYATGETTKLVGTLLIAPDLHDRVISACTVTGWNGEELITQDDYKHFKEQYDTIRDKVRILHPDFNIYNVSVGGALIENMDNLPIEELIPKLDLANQTPADVDAVIVKAIAEEEALENFSTRPQRLYDSVEDLMAYCRKVVSAAEAAQEKLRQLRMLKSNSWTEASERYSEAFNTFSELLEANVFLRDTLYYEQLSIYQAYDDFAETEEVHRENFKVDAAYLKFMIHMLDERMIPSLQAAFKRLQETYDFADVDDFAISFNAEY